MAGNLPNIYVAGNGAIVTGGAAPQTAQIVSSDVINYGEGLSYSPRTTTGFIGIENGKEPNRSVNYGLWLQDIAQSHHFTVQIDGLTTYNVPNASYSKFLPVRSMDLSYLSYENMTIPFQVFGDFPILNRKRVTTLSLTCYDNDDNTLEEELRIWERKCFPLNKYVAYMEDIARELIYRGYNVKGQQTFSARIFVIPSGSVSVSRDYSANEAKMLRFSVVAVGDGVSCATGSGVPVVDHAGAGNGRGGDFATGYVSGVRYN